MANQINYLLLQESKQKHVMIERGRGLLKRIYDIINPYSWITMTRNKLFDYGFIKSHEFKVPTICIGNISVGGTGKTPHTEYLIRLLNENFHTVVLSRGYGRKSKGYILADKNTSMSIIGDEPFQINNKFKNIGVAVCEKRKTGIERITTELPETEVILLDDAFQHRHVKAGLNILLIDSSRPIWQDCVLPFGRMRESMKGIERADIAIITKCDNLTGCEYEACVSHIRRIKKIPVFFTHMRYGELYSLFKCSTKKATKETEVLLVTGIARPEPLKKEIERRYGKVTLMRYADHHNFTTADLEKIEERYCEIKSNNKIIITTEKDATRIIDHTGTPQTVKDNIYVLPIEVEFLNEKEIFNKIILDYVTENSRNS